MLQLRLQIESSGKVSSKDDGIFHGHACTLAQPWSHWVRCVPRKCDATHDLRIGPLSVQSVPNGILHKILRGRVLDTHMDVRVPTLGALQRLFPELLRFVVLPTWRCKNPYFSPSIESTYTIKLTWMNTSPSTSTDQPKFGVSESKLYFTTNIKKSNHLRSAYLRCGHPNATSTNKTHMNAKSSTKRPWTWVHSNLRHNDYQHMSPWQSSYVTEKEYTIYHHFRFADFPTTHDKFPVTRVKNAAVSITQDSYTCSGFTAKLRCNPKVYKM